MKNKSIIASVVICVSASLSVFCYDRQDFASTTEREQREMIGIQDEARLTSYKETRENLGRVNEARLTSYKETRENMGRVNEAASTDAAKRAADYYN